MRLASSTPASPPRRRSGGGRRPRRARARPPRPCGAPLPRSCGARPRRARAAGGRPRQRDATAASAAAVRSSASCTLASASARARASISSSESWRSTRPARGLGAGRRLVDAWARDRPGDGAAPPADAGGRSARAPASRRAGRCGASCARPAPCWCGRARSSGGRCRARRDRASARASPSSGPRSASCRRVSLGCPYVPTVLQGRFTQVRRGSKVRSACVAHRESGESSDARQNIIARRPREQCSMYHICPAECQIQLLAS